MIVGGKLGGSTTEDRCTAVRELVVSKAPSASTKVDSWAAGESDFGDSPFVMARRPGAPGLPLHLRR